MYNASNVDFLELRAFVPPEKIVEAYAVHTMIECGAVLGLFWPSPNPCPGQDRREAALTPRSGQRQLFSFLYTVSPAFFR